MDGGKGATWCALAGALLALGGSAMPARANSSDGPVALALIVGNNKSLKAQRPDLRFADDDALKYALLFRTLTEPSHVQTLTRVDEETQLLFADEVTPAGAPTHDELQTAAHALRDAVASLRSAGKTTALYFVFAGHGDVELG